MNYATRCMAVLDEFCCLSFRLHDIEKLCRSFPSHAALRADLESRTGLKW